MPVLTTTEKAGYDSLKAKEATYDGKIANVVEDTTPQLGGNLDLNGKAIPLAYNAQVGTTYTAVLGLSLIHI